MELINDMLFRVDAIVQLYGEILHKIVAMLTKQFTRDMLNELCIKKKLQHTKLIEHRKLNAKSDNITIHYIKIDQSENKLVTHYLLKALVTKDSANLKSINIKELTMLCEAYKKGTKCNLITKLSKQISQAGCYVLRHDVRIDIVGKIRCML